jgi:FKBP-type peptidyl-prolyl cis-trans isomerase
MEQKQKEAGKKNKTEGAKFPEENKKKEGVKTTASGLQYKALKEGTERNRRPPTRSRSIYRGTLINGTEFDSSYSAANHDFSMLMASSRDGRRRFS